MSTPQDPAIPSSHSPTKLRWSQRALHLLIIFNPPLECCGCSSRVMKSQRCEAGIISPPTWWIPLRLGKMSTIPVNYSIHLAGRAAVRSRISKHLRLYSHLHTHTHGCTCTSGGKLSPDMELINRFMCCVQTPTLPLWFLQAEGCCLEQLQKPLWERKVRAGRWAVMAGARVSLLPGNMY